MKFASYSFHAITLLIVKKKFQFQEYGEKFILKFNLETQLANNVLLCTFHYQIIIGLLFFQCLLPCREIETFSFDLCLGFSVSNASTKSSCVTWSQICDQVISSLCVLKRFLPFIVSTAALSSKWYIGTFLCQFSLLVRAIHTHDCDVFLNFIDTN